MIRDISGDNRKRDAHPPVIIQESDRLSELVSDLLDVSQLQAGASPMTHPYLISPC